MGVDFYYFDGEHSFESQAEALPYFFPRLSDTFIFMVDDMNWTSVQAGTEAGFNALGKKVRIEKHWQLVGNKLQDDPIFWNGVGIFVCSKL